MLKHNISRMQPSNQIIYTALDRKLLLRTATGSRDQGQRPGVKTRERDQGRDQGQRPEAETRDQGQRPGAKTRERDQGQRPGAETRGRD
jgi:hypothetical protein